MNSVDLVINNNPKSMFSESIKSIRTNLQFSSVDKNLKIILFTSPEAGDGKSFIVANLAAAYAQDKKKVLIIDADLRRGRQHEIFNIVNNTNSGYSNLIVNYKEDSKLSKYVVRTGVKNIDLLPIGPIPPNPLELLSSESNAKVIASLKEHYDIILMDCAPILGISDTAMLLKYSDANLLVVSSGKTHIDLIEKAKKAFENANSKITGVVVNKVSTNDSNYYSHYYTDYYTEKDV